MLELKKLDRNWSVSRDLYPAIVAFLDLINIKQINDRL
jgi:GGDEF domain-containing protein